MAPFIDQQGWWFSVRWFDPGREEPSLVSLIPQILIEVGIGDLLQRLHIVHRDKVTIEVHEFNSHFLERSLSQQMSLDARESLVRVVVRLFNQPQFLALALVQTALDAIGRGGKVNFRSAGLAPSPSPVGLLESLQSQDEQFGVMFVGEGREGYRREPSALQPVDHGGVDGHRLLRGDVRPVLQVVVLSLLLRLQVEPSQPTQILLTHSLVHLRKWDTREALLHPLIPTNTET